MVSVGRVDRIFRKMNKLRDGVKMLQHDKRTGESRLEKFKEDVETKQKAIDRYNKASIVFKKEADQRDEEAKEALENVLNYALSNIQLEQDYRARIEIIPSNRSGKEMVVVLQDINTGFERRLKTQTGRAIRQIISFLMTVIVIKFSGASRMLLIDEQLSGLQDLETIHMFGDILVALANNEGFQFFVVEHKTELNVVEGIKVINLVLNDYERGLEIVS